MMRAMQLQSLGPILADRDALTEAQLPIPSATDDQILIGVTNCGVCHTELDIIEGRLPPPRLPLILGHQAVGTVLALGPSASGHRIGDRVGVAWIYSACGTCEYCRSDRENLCPQFIATGRDADGGYAEFMVVSSMFAIPIPDRLEDQQAAPLLCAGAIGFRSLRLTQLTDGQCLGLTGFGASGHLVLQLAKCMFPRSDIFVFARQPMDRELAESLGAYWVGDTFDNPPSPLHAIIDTTPAWFPPVAALRHLVPGGRLVINAIRKEDDDRQHLTQIEYARDLWMEREIKSVANVTREDARSFLAVAEKFQIRPHVQIYPLRQANEALRAVKFRKAAGAVVLSIERSP